MQQAQSQTRNPDRTLPQPQACNACGAPLRTRFDTVLDPQTRETFSIEECTACGLGHTSPQPAELGRYYGAAYHGGRHGFTARYCAWRRLRWLDGLAPGGGKLLDVGCGDGTFLLGAREQGWSVVGTEMNPAIARGAGLTVFESLEEAAAEQPFDAVTLWHSLEHMRDPRGTIEKAARLLKPGGAMIVAVPDAEGWQAKLFGPRWFHLDVPRHLFHFGRKSLGNILNAAGMEIAHTWNQEFELDLFGWAQSALNSFMPDPNVFFYKLTGRATPASKAQVAASFAFGSAFSAMALPAVPAGTLTGNGGTLVIASRKR